MSTTPQVPETPNPNPVTAPEAEAPPAPTAPPALPEGIAAIDQLPDGNVQVSLVSGERYVGTKDEVIATLAKSKYDSNLHRNEIKAELEQFRQQFAPPAPPAPLTPEEQAKQETKAWLKSIGVVTVDDFGVQSSEELRHRAERTWTTTEQSSLTNNTMQFWAMCPEFPQTEAASEKLCDAALAYGIATLENIDKMTPQQMALAHYACLQRGDYQALPKEQQPQRSVPQAAPMMPGTQPETSGAPNAGGVDPWRMSQKDLEALLRNQGALKR